MVKKQYQIIVLNKLRIKETLIHPEIIYQSLIFFWDGSLTSLDTILTSIKFISVITTVGQPL